MRELRIEELAESSDDDGVDAPFGRAGGESQLLSSTPSSSLEPSGSAGVTTEDRTFEDGLDESEAAFDAVYDELRCGVERYILTRAGVDASASREDRDKALDAGDFYEINKFDGTREWYAYLPLLYLRRGVVVRLDGGWADGGE